MSKFGHLDRRGHQSTKLHFFNHYGIQLIKRYFKKLMNRF